MLIACNHPNSFLDAIIVGAYMKEPVHFITRGDVFRTSIINKLLKSLKMIPIFRIRDGKDKLALNQHTFDTAQKVLQAGGIVLIFVEGFCEHQTTLQLPLKKGAARIATACWQQDIDVKILPLWLRYDSFSDYGKILDVFLGETFGQEVVNDENNETSKITAINKKIENELMHLSAIPNDFTPLSPVWKTILWPFGMLGKIIHLPFYFPIQKIVYKKAFVHRHYDSVMLAVLAIGYPLYVLLVTTIIFLIFHHWSAGMMMVFSPLLIKAYIYCKK